VDAVEGSEHVPVKGKPPPRFSSQRMPQNALCGELCRASPFVISTSTRPSL
jgi:hypothetical protein